MGDGVAVTPVSEDEDLINAVQHIVMALGKKKTLSDDQKKILADLSKQLSNATTVSEDKEDEGISEFEDRLNIVQVKIKKWDTDHTMIWDCGPEEASEYLNAVGETQRLIESIEGLCLNKDEAGKEVLRRAHDVLQTAMARLEDEFRNILVQNKQPFEHEHGQISFRSTEDDVFDDRSIISLDEDPGDESLHRDSISRESEDFCLDLVHPDSISDLKCIANSMFASSYDQECVHAFVSTRKEAFDECLTYLDMEKLCIEDVVKMEFRTLNAKIKRWTRAMKIFVRVYLLSEKALTDQIFGEFKPVNSLCFVETSRASMLQLLNFGEAVSIGPHKPEVLFRILDMYEVLKDLLPDVDTLYLDEAGSCVRSDFREVLRRLGEAVKATFLDFEKAVESNTSMNPFMGGGIHHLTRYVMNYIRALIDYNETLNFLLNDAHSGEIENPTSDSSATSIHFKSLLSVLESNLDDKSKLYRDPGLQNVFLMNNLHYMAKKVKDSELMPILGDDWVRRRNWKFQQHAMNYERATWYSILNFLRDEGIQNPGSNSISKTLLKERLRSFYLAFEEVYKNQTCWSIPDPNLREDLRISISLKVIQAYRTFAGRHSNHISDKYIKYSADDLENYLLDLFEGSPKSLPNFHKR